MSYRIILDPKAVRADVVTAINALASEFPGDDEVVMHVGNTGRRITLHLTVDSRNPVFLDAVDRIMRAHAR